MTDIALRDYDYEIEAMIEDGHFQEGIIHCYYILDLYPKNLTTYKLLGLALINNRQFSEAKDVFQRVLLAVPDDFESHEKLSGIYEKLGEINLAIHYLAQAFDLQPSDRRVQEKLRKLYSDRDGETIRELHLTRAALARMYAQSNKNELAIAEIRTLLTEDNDRIDLLILLAQLYHRISKREAALEICTIILNKSSHCLEANAIVAELLEDEGRYEEAAVHWKRVREMEPYDTRLPQKLSIDSDFPEKYCSLTHLDYTDSDQFSANRKDISSLLAIGGSMTNTSQQPNEPDQENSSNGGYIEEGNNLAWLQDAQPGPSDTIGRWLSENAPDSEASIELAGNETRNSEQELPDWLQDFSSSTFNSPDDDNVAEHTEGENITPNNIEISSLPESLTRSTGSDSDIGFDFSELLNLSDGAIDTLDGEDVELSDESSISDSGTPKQIHFSGSEKEDTIQSRTVDDDMPQWFKELSIDGEIESDIEQKEVLPDWLKDLTEEKDSDSSESVKKVDIISEDQEEYRPKEALPDWLAELSNDLVSIETDKVAENSSQGIQRKEEIPEWLRELSDEFSSLDGKIEEEASIQPSNEAEESQDWLSELSIDTLPIQQVENLPSDDLEKSTDAMEENLQIGELPEWIQDTLNSQPSTLREETDISIESIMLLDPSRADLTLENTPLEEDELDIITSEMLPDWLKEKTEEAKKSIMPKTDEIPTWIRNLNSALENPIHEPTTEEDLDFSLVTELNSLSEDAKPEDKLDVSLDDAPSFPEAKWVKETDIRREHVQQTRSILNFKQNVYKHRVYINSADIQELMMLPYIGFRQAQNIINYRRFQGQITSMVELKKILKFGSETEEVLEHFILFGESATLDESISIKSLLEEARRAYQRGDIVGSIHIYNDIIQSKKDLDKAILDLIQLTKEAPNEALLWQILGDAYVRMNNIQEALAAYNKAEELI